MFARPVCLAAALCLLPALQAGAAAQSFAPSGWADDIKLNEPADRNPDPTIVEIDLVARLADVQIDGKIVHAWTYNGGLPGPLIKTRVGDRLIVHFTQRARRADHRALARRARADRDGRRARDLAARGEEGRVVHLRLRRPRRGPVLVSPARDVGRAGRLRTVRRAARRGSRRRRRRRRSGDDRAERHRLRREGQTRARRQRRLGRHGVRSRRRLRARQRPPPAGASRASRRAATLAHRQRREEPLLLSRSRRPAVHGDRHRRRAAGESRSRPTSCWSRPASAST